MFRGHQARFATRHKFNRRRDKTLKKKGLLAVTILILAIFFAPSNVYPNVLNVSIYAETFWRTELYFGRDKNDGTLVSDGDWNKFLDEIVTPKFPAGLTVLEGNGQYRLQNGTIVKERSKILVLLYSPKTRLINSRKINEIRNQYKKRFQQESVMRIDFRQTVQVSF